jgi:hypothetical protein
MQHLFVVSYGRSGSTLVARLLNEIDGYCIRGENGGIVRTLANSYRILSSTTELIEKCEHDERSPWFGFDAVDPAEWRASLAAAFDEAILKPPAGTRVTGFKEIRYTPEDMDDALFTATMDFLALGFEDSRIVFNTRDGAEVARSAWWATDYEPAHVEEIVATCDTRFREAHARLGPERSFMIDFAQYNANPSGFLPLLDWLGEDLAWERVERVGREPLLHLKERPSPRSGRLRRWIAAMTSHDAPPDPHGPNRRDHRFRNA